MQNTTTPSIQIQKSRIMELDYMRILLTFLVVVGHADLFSIVDEGISL